MVRSSGNINAPNWELTEVCSRQPGPGACSLREYVSLHLELARTRKMKSRMRGSHCMDTISRIRASRKPPMAYGAANCWTSANSCR